MASGIGRMLSRPVKRSAQGYRFQKIRFRLYTGISFMLSGIIIVIATFFMKG